ncbi:glycine--tRNA ligase subunit beta [bacterium]|nr:glycine--tRNA ligase subunit beta [bacterium]
MSKYLLEIGTEELPYRFIPSAIEQLKKSFENLLEINKLDYSDVTVYATPRRLAVIVDGLAKYGKDEVKTIKGPIKKVAYDENGTLTPAGLGFCKKNSLDVNDLYVEADYLHAKITIKGQSVTEVLKNNVPELIFKLQGTHFMRWGANDEKFSRPIRWIVSLLDSEEVKIKIIDRESSKTSRGHRFNKEKSFEINNPDEYVEIMRRHNVIVNQEERRDLIIKLAKQEAEKLGAVPYYTDDLLEEVTFITEFPVPAVCSFDPVYLEIPEEVTVTVMAVHQRYFALYKDGKLINKFITMTNYIGDNFENIAAGNLRVIKARLDDAVFFFKEDTAKPLAEYVEDLKGITFQKGMGTMFDKAQRMVQLSRYLSDEIHADSSDIERTALLAKADLTTKLVFEFTELQGFIGADYAKVSGEKPNIVQGIKEHYFPLNAESKTAKSIEGQIAGIADKIDTICAVFVDGKKPTGSSDPLGVRRAALGIIRTILDNKLKINLNKLIEKSLYLLPVKKDCADEIREFIIQRLIIFLSEKYEKNVLESCAKHALNDLNSYIKRVETVKQINSAELLECANRVLRITKDVCPGEIKEALFVENSEKELYNAVNQLEQNENFDEYLNGLINLNPYVVNFFNDVLVMDKNESVKNNRLALLTKLKQKYEYLTDFSLL